MIEKIKLDKQSKFLFTTEGRRTHRIPPNLSIYFRRNSTASVTFSGKIFSLAGLSPEVSGLVRQLLMLKGKILFHHFAIFLIIFCTNIPSLFPQTKVTRELRKTHIATEEIISLSKTMRFDQVFSVFYDLSKKYLRKIIVTDLSLKFPIGVDIDKMHWLDAFELILRTNKLWYEQHDDYLKIVPAETESQEQSGGEKSGITFHDREVIISAIFFEADGSKLSQSGFSWRFLRGHGVNLDASMSAADDKPSLFQLEVKPDLDFGSLLALFKSFESDQIGEIIASPQITVRSGVKGKIQVGSDIAVTTVDFAGNTVNQFFSTGSIVEVTPEVIRYDSTDFIHLELKIERSNNASSASGIEIKKSLAQTSILLLDKEESLIGGLYVNEESKTREGVPLLKDLPWWFFGLKYLFGYQSKKIIKKELLIIIKAELVPTLATRLQEKNQRNKQKLLRQKRMENLLEMKRMKEQIRGKN